MLAGLLAKNASNSWRLSFFLIAFLSAPRVNRWKICFVISKPITLLFIFRVGLLISKVLHGMKANHIALSIISKGNKPVFTNREFFFEDTATILGSTGGLHCTVFTRKIN
jgi:hypothetical protein